MPKTFTWGPVGDITGIAYRRAAQTPVGDSMSVAFVDADFGLAFSESTAICPRQSLCAPAL